MFNRLFIQQKEFFLEFCAPVLVFSTADVRKSLPLEASEVIILCLELMENSNFSTYISKIIDSGMY